MTRQNAKTLLQLLPWYLFTKCLTRKWWESASWVLSCLCEADSDRLIALVKQTLSRMWLHLKYCVQVCPFHPKTKEFSPENKYYSARKCKINWDNQGTSPLHLCEGSWLERGMIAERHYWSLQIMNSIKRITTRFSPFLIILELRVSSEVELLWYPTSACTWWIVQSPPTLIIPCKWEIKNLVAIIAGAILWFMVLMGLHCCRPVVTGAVET